MTVACDPGSGDQDSPVSTVEATVAETATEATETPTPTLAPQSTATPQPLSDCQAAFRSAALVPAESDRVEDLDPAVRACASVAEWERASANYPDALDGTDPEQFALNRCRFGVGLSATPLCGELIGEFTEAEARDRVVECLAALPPLPEREAEIAQLRRGVSSLRFDGGWFIERSDPAKFDLPDFPAWEVEDGGRVLALSDAAAALIPLQAEVLCE